jgi:anti-sigma regulatory factor (Ser/Thr protein kinase)
MEAISVREPTDVANARRRIGALATRLRYDETAAGRVAIVVTELAQNLLRHGGGGEMLAGADADWAGGIEITALDRGPGMANVAACLRDGYSTGGTSGTGLGAVARLARQLLVHSVPKGGTAVLVRMGGDGAADASVPRATAALCVAKTGETVCGDAAAIVVRPDGMASLMLADGLGHGPQAAAASDEAARLFRKHAARSDTLFNVADSRGSSRSDTVFDVTDSRGSSRSDTVFDVADSRGNPRSDTGRPTAILAALHAGLRATRGAAVAIAAIDPAAREVTYSGIGNIAGFIIDTGGVRRMVSHSGTAGHTAGRLQDFRYPLHNRPVLVMYSDGLATSWSPEAHSGLFSLDPLLIAGVLYRDHARGRDDASVVVWKG